MRFGTAFHLAVLEPDMFQTTYYSDPHRRTTRESKLLAEKNVGKLRLTEHDYRLCQTLAKVAWNHRTAMEECRIGTIERPIVAKMHNGLTVKCKPDLINDGGIYDLKSLGKPINMFTEGAFNLGYHIQAAFYTGVLFGVERRTGRDFSFWVVSKCVPYQCGFFRIAWEECMALWREVCVPALNDIAAMMRGNEWAEDPTGSLDRRMHIPAKLTKYRYATHGKTR
jgi:hypothetical protein